MYPDKVSGEKYENSFIPAAAVILPLRCQKAGRFVKLLGFARSHSIV